MSDTGASRPLIVDLGMHRGDDTDFYLRKGFDVLAVEAVPELVERAEARFRDAVESGRLTIRNVAVTDYEGEVEFYLSDEDLWGSTREDVAGRFGLSRRKITAPCTTLDKILADHPVPYYVKIDVEGRDGDCVEALGRMGEKPKFVSFEADLGEPDETFAMLDLLESYGYRRYKFVNQATHPQRRLPKPALEGDYVDARFTKHMSGPFGEEAPGPWRTLDEVRERYLETIKHQAARIEYGEKGTLFGVPLARFYRPLLWFYNVGPVTWVRVKYAERRGVEVGGWFDIHAAM